MANYETLKSAIQQVVKTNGNNEITGALLQQSLLAMINSLGAGYQFIGVATPSTNPGTLDQKVFYIANGKGTYTNFGGLSITEDEVVILYYDTAWHKLLTGIASEYKQQSLENTINTATGDINYGREILNGNGGYDLRTATVGSTYTGVVFSVSYESRYRLDLKKGQRAIIKTYAYAEVPGYFQGYVITDANNIVREKYIASGKYYDTINNPLIINAEYDCHVYINCYNTHYDDFGINVLGVINGTLYNLSQSVDDFRERINGLGKFEKSINELGVTSNKYIRYDAGTGTVIEGSLPGGCYTDFFRVEPGRNVVIKNCGLYAILGVCYDENKNPLGGMSADSQDHEEYEFIAPDGAFYVRINLKLGYDTTLCIKGYEDNVEFVKLILYAQQIYGLDATIRSIIGKESVLNHKIIKPLGLSSGKILLSFGDSITAGVASQSSYSAGNPVDDGGDKYKYINVVANQFGLTLINYGVSGSTVTDRTSAGVGWLYNKIQQAITAGLNPDIISVAIGVNDYNGANNNLGTINDIVGSNPNINTFYGAFNRELALIKSSWPGVPVIVITPINCLINSATYANSLHQFRQAEYDVAILNDCSIISGELLPIPNERGIMADILLADNLHPSSLGHKTMGEAISGLIG